MCRRPWLTLALVLAIASARPAGATTIILRDVSGSMAAELAGGRSKHDEASAAVLAELPRYARLGPTALWAFGGACKSLRREGAFLTDAAALRDEVARTGAPNGSTPLYFSILRAIRALAAEPLPRNLVVITDELDTCGENVCSLRALADAEQVAMRIIAVMPGGSRAAQVLTCLGPVDAVQTPSDGREGLGGALARATDAFAKQPGELLIAVRDATGNEAHVGVALRRGDGGDEQTATSGAPVSLAPGKWLITRIGTARPGHAVTIEAGKRLQFDFSLPLGRFEVVASCGDGHAFSLLDERGSVVGSGVVGNAIDVPPGSYELLEHLYPDALPRRVEVAANQVNRVAIGGFGLVAFVAEDVAGKPFDASIACYANDDARGGAAPPVLRTTTGVPIRLHTGQRYNCFAALETTSGLARIEGANVALPSASRCEDTHTVKLVQVAAVLLCGASPGGVLVDNRTGEQTNVATGEPVSVKPGTVFNVSVDGRRFPNLVMKRGLNRVNCS